MKPIPIHIVGQFDLLKQYGINSKIRLAHFLSQVAHESGWFNVTVENLNYSADGLMRIFPKYFTNEQAMKYARQPEKIANHVYSNRMGNGDESSGDGWKFRGRGFIQLTGAENYKKFAEFIKDAEIITNPDIVATKYALTSAAWFFNVNGINKISDLGVSDAAITSVTKKVNGGTNGLSERIEFFREIYAQLK